MFICWKVSVIMPLHEQQLHLICYDIADPRRLARVYRQLTAVALPLQYSVFVAYLRPADVPDLVAQLEEIINLHEDDIRIYPLPGKPQFSRFGNVRFPDGIRLLENGKDLIGLGETLESATVKI
jgi:CRISPR-associated protein Cas2